MPPNGSRGSEATIALTNSAPERIRRPTVETARRSGDQTAAPSPYAVSLASSTAWSSSRARTTAATGPKVSSSNAVIRGVTWSSTVGG